MTLNTHRLSIQKLNEILHQTVMHFAGSIAETLAAMNNFQTTLSEYSCQTHEDYSGICIYCHFIGSVQGIFLISMSCPAAHTLSGVPYENNVPGQDVFEFLKEVLNVAVANTLPLLETTFGHLSYSPPISVDGRIQFPEFATSHVDIQTPCQEKIQAVMFLDLAEIKIGTELKNIRRSLDETRKSAHFDALTKVYNRTYFNESYYSTIHECHERNHTLAMLWIDIDNFKRYNDNYGHHTGDMALQRLGEAIASSIRHSDSAYRYGGDEFIILLPTASLNTGRQVATNLSEYLRAHPLEVHQNERKSQVCITLSIGLSALIPDENPDLFLHRTDALLYQAKRQGKNQIVTENSSTPFP